MKATITRRNFIRVVGAAGVVAVTGAGANGCHAVPDEATAPWAARVGQSGDIRRKVLSYALLAPNPHNRQPWLVDLSRPERIVLYCDTERLLPETDPYNRQILIGHGAFLELLSLAAQKLGYRAEIKPFPQGPFPKNGVDDRPVAEIRLIAGDLRPSDSLFDSILLRRTNRLPFDTGRPVKALTLSRLAEALRPGKSMRLVTEYKDDQVGLLRKLIIKGMETETLTPRTHMETVNLMRIGREEIGASPDGVSLSGPIIEIGRMLGLITRKKMADPESSAFAEGLKMQRKQALSATAFGWLISPDNSRLSQLEAGRNYARLNLRATALGLAMHPWSQVLQEYPEMAPWQKLFFQQSGQQGTERTQMLFRLGYAKNPGPSPRWPLETLIRT